MTFVQRLDLRQSQTLVMTPQLQQAIKLLQLNNLEIADFIAQEMQQNPLLDEGDRSDGEAIPVDAEGSHDRVAAVVSDGPTMADDQAARIADGAMSDTADASNDSGG